MQRVLDAIEAFWYYLSDVRALPLAAAIGCQLLKVACTSRAWRNVLAAAYPDERVRWLPIYGSVVAGAGVNALFPARAGDVVRLFLARRAVPGSTYTTLVSSMLVLTIVDLSIALGLFIWALTQGVLPSLDVLPSLPSFDFRWFLEHGQVSEFILAFLVVGLIALAVWARPRWRELGGTVRAGLHDPPHPGPLFAHGRPLAALRLGSAPDHDLALSRRRSESTRASATSCSCRRPRASPRSSRSARAASAPSRRSCSTPFAARRRRTALLAFSVGMKITLTAVNVAVGFAAILLTLGTLRFRRATAARGWPNGPYELSPRPAGPVELGVHGPRRLRRQPGNGLELLLARRDEQVGRAEVVQDRAAPATGPIPSRVSKIDANARVSRRWRW